MRSQQHLVLSGLILLSGCTSEEAPEPATPVTTPALQWLGRWTGPEGTYMDLARTDAAYRKVAGKSGVDAPFLSNHDQDRVMSQLDGNPQHMRMAAAMLLTLPGHPFVYYGEELGMRGRKPDPDLREPMRWHRDPQGTEFAPTLLD